MLLPSPEVRKRLEKYQTIDPIEAKALQLEWNRLKRRRNRLLRFVAGTALLSSGVGAYFIDVAENQQTQADASISIEVKGGALDASHNDNALAFIDGFGSSNGDILAKYMSRAIQPVIDGQVWSVDYNNAPLEPSAIAAQMIKTAERNNVTSLSIVGYSAGGDVAMQVQEEVRKKSDLEIDAIFLISTPDGAKALRPARQDEIELVEKFAWIPGIQYSTYLRSLGELAFRADQYNSGTLEERASHFISTANEVHDSLENNKLPGTWLMFDQMLAIENANLKARINAMKDIPDDEVRPTIVYLGTAKPGYDYMVDNEKTSQALSKYTDDANVPFFSYDVPGAVHTRIDLANDQYIATLAAAKKDIRDSIRREKRDAYFYSLSEINSPATTSGIDAAPTPAPTETSADISKNG